MALLKELRADGLTILLVEHDMELVMSVVDRIVVMDFGSKLCGPAGGNPRRQAGPGSLSREPSHGALLTLDKVSVSYGHIEAVREVSLSIDKGPHRHDHRTERPARQP